MIFIYNISLVLIKKRTAVIGSFFGAPGMGDR